MDKDAILTMKSIQSNGDDVSEIELTTECRFRKITDGYEIMYNESEATGFMGSKTVLTFSGNNFASIVRSGSFDSSLQLESGKKHFCNYGTPYGSFTVGINATKITNNLSDDGGSAYVKYTVDLNPGYVSDTEIFFTVS